MTQEAYHAALDHYIPLAEKWADSETKMASKSNRKRVPDRWNRHFCFAMDEARRRCGLHHSYDLAPDLIRPPQVESAKYTTYEVARWVLAAETVIEFESKYCDISTAKKRFGVRRFSEAKEAARAYLAEHHIEDIVADYRSRLCAYYDAQVLDKAG